MIELTANQFLYVFIWIACVCLISTLYYVFCFFRMIIRLFKRPKKIKKDEKKCEELYKPEPKLQLLYDKPKETENMEKIQKEVLKKMEEQEDLEKENQEEDKEKQEENRM